MTCLLFVSGLHLSTGKGRVESLKNGQLLAYIVGVVLKLIAIADRIPPEENQV